MGLRFQIKFENLICENFNVSVAEGNYAVSWEAFQVMRTYIAYYSKAPLWSMFISCFFFVVVCYWFGYDTSWGQSFECKTRPYLNSYCSSGSYGSDMCDNQMLVYHQSRYHRVFLCYCCLFKIYCILTNKWLFRPSIK